MSLFQKSVLSSYLESVSDSDIDKGWVNLQSYKKMASKVQSFKEEEFQAKFLEKIFVGCFGYKSQYDSAEEGNLFFEQKNTSNSKKADGAIKKDGEVIAVIELKSTKTKNLDDVKDQAYGYYNNNSKCEYVITSNFNKVRFYIERNEDYLEFDLFNMNKEEFKLLWLCLNSSNLLEGKPKEIKNKSIVSEEAITKKLYQDYSSFRLELFNDLLKNNPNIEKKVILNKTQKLLDRILFILFAEDRGLLPTNSISEIINFWNTKKEFGDDEYLYNTFVTYFDVINKGRQKRGNKNAIYSYNGGLFQEDDVLDSLVVSNEILLKYTQKLTAYDFESDVSVDILGHIFELSLSEIEELQNQIDGVEIDKSKSKRKKDGVYYTPKYITKYIVDNTLGKLCNERKIELDINEETYSPSARRSRNRNNALDEYRNWLLKLTICDPACGSGAFLIQALNFLIKEHHYIDELSTSYNKHSLLLSDVKNSILENNLYGVDINQESVEIAKLSLWLNTAESNRKLTSLNNNIKCGNSLINDPEFAGEKAFNWESEFPEVFANGGFDVVIGNPPYVDNRGFDKTELNFLYNNYPNSFEKSGTGKYKTTKLNLIAPFIEINESILKKEGLLSYIFHKNIFKTNSYTAIRKYILGNYNILSLTDWGANQFADVVAETATFTLEKTKNIDDKISVNFYNLSNKYKENFQSHSEFQNAYEYIFGINLSIEDRKLTKKIEEKTEILENFVNVNNGIVTGNDKKYIKKEQVNEKFKKIVRGKNIKRYNCLASDEFLEYKEEDLMRARDESIFLSEEKLIMQMINISFVITYDDCQFYNLGTTYAITLKDEVNLDLKYLLVLLNSKLISFYYLKKFTNESSLTNAISTKNLFQIPIKITKNQIPFVQKAEKILTLNKDLQDISSSFQRIIKRNFESLEKLSRKLEYWYELNFADFVKELKKKKTVLSLEKEAKWEKYFLTEQEKAIQFRTRADKVDKEIDQMVYQLYGLTDEEIKIVEDSTN